MHRPATRCDVLDHDHGRGPRPLEHSTRCVTPNEPSSCTGTAPFATIDGSRGSQPPPATHPLRERRSAAASDCLAAACCAFPRWARTSAHNSKPLAHGEGRRQRRRHRLGLGPQLVIAEQIRGSTPAAAALPTHIHRRWSQREAVTTHTSSSRPTLSNTSTYDAFPIGQRLLRRHRRPRRVERVRGRVDVAGRARPCRAPPCTIGRKDSRSIWSMDATASPAVDVAALRSPPTQRTR